jgi:ligand-binding SRPBCC domain-containing protein
VDRNILLTGATGYIGGLLLRRFEEGGRAVRCLVRQPARLASEPTTEVIQGDCLDEALLDVIDGWTVEGYEADRRLRLSADLMLPGRGWLEFEVAPLDGGQRSMIRQTATFDPRGLLGRAYWYAVLPVHALMFRGLLRHIARRATNGDRDSQVALFTFRSIVHGRAADVFQWHERPEALLELIPSAKWMRIERRTGGLRDGGRVTFSVGAGPVRLFWEARHYGYVRGRQFCDEQLHGPFRIWRHTHRIEPIGAGQTLYEDHIEFVVRGGPVMQWLTKRILGRMLARAFARRHRIVAAHFNRSVMVSA